MERTSSAIGALAGALAKAQAELLNPEKTLTATIRTALSPSGERTFRYASLASGLDIVRKCLGKQEIAVVQQTAIDRETGLVKLRTVLAHSSGEWISSEWPVCPVSEMSSPHRMGAALTYARRYALFTLVGIAGEDDLDAPDIPTNSISALQPSHTKPPLQPNQGNNGSPFHRNRNYLVLSSEGSSAKRRELMAELDAISSPQELTNWAHRCLPIKNTLSADDAILLDTAFHKKLVAFDANEAAAANHSQNPDLHYPKAPRHGRQAGKRSNSKTESAGIDKSVLAIPTIKRHRRKDHLRLVATQACLICGRQPSDAHHLRFAQPRGLGLKVSDEFTVPLCRIHHREVHRHSKERAWWQDRNIEPLAIARTLWVRSQDPATHNSG